MDDLGLGKIVQQHRGVQGDESDPVTLFTVLAEVKQESEQYKQHCKHQEQHIKQI